MFNVFPIPSLDFVVWWLFVISAFDHVVVYPGPSFVVFFYKINIRNVVFEGSPLSLSSSNCHHSFLKYKKSVGGGHVFVLFPSPVSSIN